MYSYFGVTETEFKLFLKPSTDILERSVALPIMVKPSLNNIEKQYEALKLTL